MRALSLLSTGSSYPDYRADLGFLVSETTNAGAGGGGDADGLTLCYSDAGGAAVRELARGTQV